jgi:predicted hydrocarbon binding protein
MPEQLREQLGDFSSIICLKAIITGMEDALGEKATAISLIAAGRARGKKLAESLGLVGVEDFETVTQALFQALGPEGTRLLILEKIVRDGNCIKVYVKETICSAGEPQGSTRQCTFTLGAVWGALEKVLNKRLQGKHTESVLRGGSYDVFEFTELG